jgi:hypothetical protein
MLEKIGTKDRLDTLKSGAILSTFCAAGMLIGNAIPHERRTTTIHNEVHRRIVRRVEIVRKVPVALPVPEALADMRRACGGDIVRVSKVMVTENDGRASTWLQVQRPGDAAETSCHLNGDYKKEYAPGTTIRLIGKVDGDPAED